MESSETLIDTLFVDRQMSYIIQFFFKNKRQKADITIKLLKVQTNALKHTIDPHTASTLEKRFTFGLYTHGHSQHKSSSLHFE